MGEGVRIFPSFPPSFRLSATLLGGIDLCIGDSGDGGVGPKVAQWVVGGTPTPYG